MVEDDFDKFSEAFGKSIKLGSYEAVQNCSEIVEFLRFSIQFPGQPPSLKVRKNLLHLDERGRVSCKMRRSSHVRGTTASIGPQGVPGSEPIPDQLTSLIRAGICLLHGRTQDTLSRILVSVSWSIRIAQFRLGRRLPLFC